MLDVETTGLDPYVDRIVEIACVIVAPGSAPKTFRQLVNPKIPIPAEATAVHGITDAAVRTAQSFADVGVSLAEFMDAAGPMLCAAFNAKFDRAFIAAEYLRHHQVVPAWCAESTRWLDPYVFARRYLKYEKGSKKLGDCARLLKVEAGEAHSALGDCMTAQRITYRLRQLGVIPDAWEGEQKLIEAEDRLDYLKRKAKANGPKSKRGAA